MRLRLCRERSFGDCVLCKYVCELANKYNKNYIFN